MSCYRKVNMYHFRQLVMYQKWKIRMLNFVLKIEQLIIKIKERYSIFHSIAFPRKFNNVAPE